MIDEKANVRKKFEVFAVGFGGVLNTMEASCKGAKLVEGLVVQGGKTPKLANIVSRWEKWFQQFKGRQFK